jgi:hypothetical protein
MSPEERDYLLALISSDDAEFLDEEVTASFLRSHGDALSPFRQIKTALLALNKNLSSENIKSLSQADDLGILQWHPKVVEDAMSAIGEGKAVGASSVALKEEMEGARAMSLDRLSDIAERPHLLKEVDASKAELIAALIFARTIPRQSNWLFYAEMFLKRYEETMAKGYPVDELRSWVRRETVRLGIRGTRKGLSTDLDLSQVLSWEREFTEEVTKVLQEGSDEEKRSLAHFLAIYPEEKIRASSENMRSFLFRTLMDVFSHDVLRNSRCYEAILDCCPESQLIKSLILGELAHDAIEPALDVLRRRAQAKALDTSF